MRASMTAGSQTQSLQCGSGRLVPETDQEVRTKDSGGGSRAIPPLPVLVRFGLSTRNPDRVCPAPAACGEDFVSATGAIIDETRAVPLSAASSLGVFTLLLTSP